MLASFMENSETSMVSVCSTLVELELLEMFWGATTGPGYSRNLLGSCSGGGGAF